MFATKPDKRGGFTAQLWHSIGDLYGRILGHPFLRGLTDGTLPEECFRHYILQDALYLKDFARALSLAGIRSSSEDPFLMFSEHATGAIQVERSLHEGFLQDFGISREEADVTARAPTTLAYSSYLLRVATLGDYPEVLGAVLPCYWIYAEVGGTLVERGSPDPRYQTWIDTYGGEEFAESVRSVLDLTESVCEGLDKSRKAAVTERFVTTSRYEWMFWDAAWRLEEWPV